MLITRWNIAVLVIGIQIHCAPPSSDIAHHMFFWYKQPLDAVLRQGNCGPAYGHCLYLVSAQNDLQGHCLVFFLDFFDQPRASDRAVGSIVINQVIGEVVPDLQHHLAIRRCFDLAFVRHHFGKVPVSIAYLKQQSIFAG